MKKILFTLAVIGATVFNSFAQTTTTSTATSPATGGAKINIGAEGGLPLGDEKDGYSAIAGGSVKYEIPTAPNTFFTFSAGYNSYLVKSEFKDFATNVGYVPVKAGLKYYSEGNFFLEGQLGIVFGTTYSGHAFVYSPGIGVTLNCGLELGVRYEAWVNQGTVDQVGLRLGFRF